MAIPLQARATGTVGSRDCDICSPACCREARAQAMRHSPGAGAGAPWSHGIPPSVPLPRAGAHSTALQCGTRSLAAAGARMVVTRPMAGPEEAEPQWPGEPQGLPRDPSPRAWLGPGLSPAQAGLGAGGERGAAAGPPCPGQGVFRDADERRGLCTSPWKPLSVAASPARPEVSSEGASSCGFLTPSISGSAGLHCSGPPHPAPHPPAAAPLACPLGRGSCCPTGQHRPGH